MNKRTHAKKSNKPRSRLTKSDIPVRPKRTYETISAAFPLATDRAVVHANSVGTLTATATSYVNTTYYFSMTLSNATVGNYDQYRLMALRFSILPQNNAIGLVTNSTTSLVPLYCVIDYDDATGLTSAAQAQGYNNCITLSPGESLSRTFRPHMALAAYSGSFGSFANVEPMWIDAANTGVQHYGIKVFIPGATAAQTLLQSWQVVAEYCWELKNNLA
jgi:hypothetical protein